MSRSSPIGVLQQLSPVSKTYVLGDGLDFLPFVFSGLGDVTAAIFAVDATLPPTPLPSSESGCEMSDFAGLPVGSIALIQRGTCPFVTKIFNAAAAGAVGVLIFNEGQPGRMEPFEVSLDELVPLPAVFTSFAVGLELYNAWLEGRRDRSPAGDGEYTVRNRSRTWQRCRRLLGLGLR